MRRLVNFLWDMPDFQDQRTKQQVDLLLVLLHVWLAFGSFIVIFRLLLFDALAFRWFFALGFALIYAGTLISLKRGRPILAANFFLGGCWLLLSISIAYTGGLFAVGLSTYTALIFAAGMLRGEWAAFRLTAANLLVSFALFWGANAGYLPPLNLFADPLAPPRAIVLGNLLALLLTFFVVRRQTGVQNKLDQASQDLLAHNKAIQASEQRYRSLLEQSPFSTIIFSPDGHIRYLNPAARQLWHIGPGDSEAITASFNMLHNSDIHMKGLMTAIQQGFGREAVTLPPIQYSLSSAFPELALADNRSLWLQSHIYPIRLDDGQITEVVLMLEDVTERKEAEQVKWQAQKMDGLGLLAGGIAHDFNNILAAIMAQASVAQFQLAKDARAQASLEKIITATEQGALLTGQLLTYAGNNRFIQQTLNLNQLVSQNLHLFQLAIPRHIRLESDLAPELANVAGDPGQLQQVIMNLLLNGAEAIGSAAGVVQLCTTMVNLEAGNEHHFPLTGFSLPAGAYVSLAISDNGVGIAAEAQERIFEPFYSTKATGRGLGLAAVRGIIQAHQGALAVSSKPGQGTTFTIYLPITHQPLPVTEISPQTDFRLPPDTIILAIDDEAPVRQAIAAIVEQAGADCLEADSGQAGVDLFIAQQDAVDLVVLDLTMPGMNGQDTLLALHAIDPGLPVILCSGYTDVDLTATPSVPFLPKPFVAADLLQLIQQSLTPE
ncbi:MAG: response regulator [Ardenticatenales bacterium]|nr:response regulator [Ardenticatenales bacterium]